MKILNKIFHFTTFISVSLFMTFLLAGIICGEARVPFLRSLITICFIYMTAVAVLFIAGLTVFLIKPAKLAKKKIRKAYRLIKYLIRTALSDEEDFF